MQFYGNNYSDSKFNEPPPLTCSECGEEIVVCGGYEIIQGGIVCGDCSKYINNE